MEEAQKLWEEMLNLFKDSHKNAKHTLFMGKYQCTYNPYNDEEEKEAMKMYSIYISEATKNGIEAAYIKLEEFLKK